MQQRDDPREIRALEEELFRSAPEPAFEFFHELQHALLRPTPAPRRAPRRTARVAVAGAMTAAVAVGLGSTVGLGYAASSLQDAAALVKRATGPTSAAIVRRDSAGGDQYRPGYGFGDANHNHEGPPGLSREKTTTSEDSGTIPARPTKDALAKVVGTAVNFDEQVHLWISVIDPSGKPLLLTQKSKRGGSTVGQGLSGPQTKFIQYAVLVPRTIPIRLRVPGNLLNPRVRYRIRIVAIDPQGNRSQLLIPFRA